jgi:hypothetical protein
MMVVRLSRPMILGDLADSLESQGEFYLHCAAAEELLMNAP